MEGYAVSAFESKRRTSSWYVAYWGRNIWRVPVTNAHSNPKCSQCFKFLIGCAAGATDAVQHWDKRLDHPKAVYVLTQISGRSFSPKPLHDKNAAPT